MKYFFKGFVLGLLTIIIIFYSCFLWDQKDQQMLMKHWLELIFLEAIVLEWSYLIKLIFKNDKNNL